MDDELKKYNSQQFAALYSPVQKCCHVEGLSDALAETHKQFYNGRIMQAAYFIFYIGTYEECHKVCAKLLIDMRKDEN